MHMQEGCVCVCVCVCNEFIDMESVYQQISFVLVNGCTMFCVWIVLTAPCRRTFCGEGDVLYLHWPVW